MLVVLDKKKYAVDLNKLMEWVSKTPSNERNITTVITEVFPSQTDEGDIMDISSKEINESKSSLNETMNNFRYDFVKFMFSNLFELSEDNLTSGVEMSFTQKLCFNTLLNAGIITEIK